MLTMVSSNTLTLLHDILNIDLPRLSNRFKKLEVVGGIVKEPIAIRLDGVRFSKILKDFRKPRDIRVHVSLVKAAKELMKWFNADLSYVSSDEINLIIMKPLPYGGRVFKLVSISSSIISSHTSLNLGIPLYFDSRVIKLQDVNDAKEYIMFRARVTANNYISLIYHELFDIKRELTPPTPRMFEELVKKGIIDKVMDWEIIGTCIHWITTIKHGYNPITKEHVRVFRRSLNETSDLNACLNALSKGS